MYMRKNFLFLKDNANHYLIILIFSLTNLYPIIEFLSLPSGIYPLSLIALSLLSIFISFLKKHKIDKDKLLWLLLFWLLFFLFVFGLIRTPAFTSAIIKVKGIFFRIMFPTTAIILTKFKRKYIKKLSIVFIITSLIVGFLMLFINESWSGNRLTLINSNPIWVSRSISMGMTSSLYLFFIDNQIFNLLLYLSFMLFFLIIMGLTGSRGPLLSVLVGVCFMIFMVRKINYNLVKNKYYIIFFIIFMIFLFLSIYANIENKIGFSRAFSFFNDKEKSIELRIKRISNSLQYFSYYPILGGGTSSSGWAYTKMDLREYPHNIIVEVLTEVGILGLILFIILLLYVIISCIKNKFLFLFSIFIQLFLNSMISGDFMTNEMFFLIMGLIVAYNGRRKYEGNNINYNNYL